MESIGMSFIKYALFIFNLIFAISGIGIIVAGGIVLSDVAEYDHFLDSRILAPPVVLIVVGSIIFLVAFLGCFGAIRESSGMLIAFAVCLLIIFIMELAVGITAACYHNEFEMALKDSLKNSMANYTISESEKNAWDKIQKNLSCCGIDGPNDWQGQAVPMSCCQKSSPNNEAASTYCRQNQNDEIYLSSTGCYGKLRENASGNVKALIGVGIGIAFVQVIGIILSCWLASTIRKQNKK